MLKFILNTAGMVLKIIRLVVLKLFLTKAQQYSFLIYENALAMELAILSKSSNIEDLPLVIGK